MCCNGTPTREEIRQRVQDNFVHFVSDIDCRTLSDYLIQHRVISGERWEEIRNTEPTDRRKNRALVNWILDTNNPKAFTALREALESDDHWLLGVIDQPTKPAVLSNDEIKSRVKENYESFLTDIDADSLSDWLQTERVITRHRLRQIMTTESTKTDKNRDLLDCLFNSSDPNAFTALRKALEMEDHWLLTLIDQPLKLPTKGQEDFLAEIKQLQEENEELRQKLKEKQETLIQDKELTQGVKKKEWASTLNQKLLEKELKISQKRMARNNQVLESLMEELTRHVFFRYDPSIFCSYKDSCSSRLCAREPRTSTKAEPEQSLSDMMTRGRSESLDVEPADENSESKTGQSDVKNTNNNNAAKMQRRDTTQSDSHRTQKDPLIVEIPGCSSKVKLCELRIHPEFDGYGFILETERNDSQLYSHRIYKIERESPADRSGLLRGDRIAEVNGVSVMKKPHNEVIKAMRMFPSRITLLLADQERGKAVQEYAVDQSKESVDAAPNASSDTSLSTTGPNIYYKTTPVLLPTIRTDASRRNDRLRICGITTLNDELYIVTKESAEVEIYNSVTCCFVRRWTLDELMNPCDISSCQKSKCLYIMSSVDASQINHIMRVASNGILINSFSTGDASAQSLSVTDESHVVVAISDKGKLAEYSSNGQIIREIKILPETGITHLLHALKLSSDLYLVSHGDEDGGLQRVCIVNPGGDIVKSFGADLDPKVGGMDGPLYMTVDEEGRIMVTDYGNSRVLLLNSSLEVERILLEKKHGLCLPWRIHFSALQKRLFVSNSDYSFEKEQIVGSILLAFEVR